MRVRAVAYLLDSHHYKEKICNHIGIKKVQLEKAKQIVIIKLCFANVMKNFFLLLILIYLKNSKFNF